MDRDVDSVNEQLRTVLIVHHCATIIWRMELSTMLTNFFFSVGQEAQKNLITSVPRSHLQFSSCVKILFWPWIRLCPFFAKFHSWKQQYSSEKVRCFSLLYFPPVTINKCTHCRGRFYLFLPVASGQVPKRMVLFLGPMLIFLATSIYNKAHAWTYICDMPYCSGGGSRFFWNVGILL